MSNMFYEVVVLKCSFKIFSVFRILSVSEEGPTLRRTLKIISDSNCEVLKNVAHNGKITFLQFIAIVSPLDMMQTIKSNYKTIRMRFHIFVVVLENFPHFIKFSLRNGFHHVFAVLSVIKQTSTLTRTTKLVQSFKIVRPKRIQYLFRTQRLHVVIF